MIKEINNKALAYQMEEWLDNTEKKNLTETRYKLHKNRIETYIRKSDIGTESYEWVSPTQINDFFRTMAAKGCSLKIIKFLYQMLYRFYIHKVNYENLSYNPMNHVNLPTQTGLFPDTKTEIISENEGKDDEKAVDTEIPSDKRNTNFKDTETLTDAKNNVSEASPKELLSSLIDKKIKEIYRYRASFCSSNRFNYERFNKQIKRNTYPLDDLDKICQILGISTSKRRLYEYNVYYHGDSAKSGHKSNSQKEIHDISQTNDVSADSNAYNGLYGKTIHDLSSTTLKDIKRLNKVLKGMKKADINLQKLIVERLSEYIPDIKVIADNAIISEDSMIGKHMRNQLIIDAWLKIDKSQQSEIKELLKSKK